ncbi:hypothetical protein EZS27_043188, partial [termite gut metagenome]
SLHYSARLGLATLNQREEKFREAIDILEGLIAEYPTEMELYVATLGTLPTVWYPFF